MIYVAFLKLHPLLTLAYSVEEKKEEGISSSDEKSTSTIPASKPQFPSPKEKEPDEKDSSQQESKLKYLQY